MGPITVRISAGIWSLSSSQTGIPYHVVKTCSACLSLHYSHCLEWPPHLLLVKISPPSLVEMPLHQADSLGLWIPIPYSKPFPFFYQLSCDLSFYLLSLVILNTCHLTFQVFVHWPQPPFQRKCILFISASPTALVNV